HDEVPEIEVGVEDVVARPQVHRVDRPPPVHMAEVEGDEVAAGVALDVDVFDPSVAHRGVGVGERVGTRAQGHVHADHAADVDERRLDPHHVVAGGEIRAQGDPAVDLERRQVDGGLVDAGTADDVDQQAGAGADVEGSRAADVEDVGARAEDHPQQLGRAAGQV